MILSLDQAQFGYGQRTIIGVERLTLQAGQSLGVFGPNGSGKTTLLRGITGLLAPLRGKVVRHGEPNIAYLPQHQSMDSHWPLSGFDAAAMIISSRRRLGWVGSARQQILEMMRELNVESLANRPFFSLSGGQQQRLLLAAALATRPDVLVLDEPSAGLDVQSQKLLLEVINRFTRAGLSCVIISHEIEDLVDTCQEVARVHSADSADGPSWVELLSPRELAEQLFATGRRS